MLIMLGSVRNQTLSPHLQAMVFEILRAYTKAFNFGDSMEDDVDFDEEVESLQ